MKVQTMKLALFMGLVGGILAAPGLYAGDLDDGISEATDEPISADDNLGSKDTNVNFIVVDAIAKAKMQQAADKSNSKDKDHSSQGNFNDGSGDRNENSVVVEPGAKIDKVYNIVIQK